MRNISMFIRGAIGIKKGLGRDEIFFDLSDKTGLVALAGPNGKGKTTVLELMSLYRTLASRKGALKHHFFLRDSRVEHKFIYNGDKYHIIWKIDSGSDKSEAFIMINGDSIVNGKNIEYDKYIIDEFGSQVLFYNSVFCAQGSGNLSTMTTGKIKELFVEFLRIERLAEYEKQCKQAVAYCQKKIDVLSGKIETCQDELSSFENIDKKISASDYAIADKNRFIKDTNKEIEQIEKKISDLKSKSEKQSADLKRKIELESDITKLKYDRDQVRKKIGLEEKTFIEKKSLLDKDMLPVLTILAVKEKIYQASSRIKNLEKWEKYFSECFECSMEEQARLDRRMKDIESSKQADLEKIKALEDDLILDGLKTTLNYLESKKFDFDSKHTVMQSKLKSAQNDFSLMQASSNLETCKEKIAVAIKPDCEFKDCPAFMMVANAKEELPELEKIEADIKKKVDTSIKETEKAITLCAANLLDIDDKIKSCSIDFEKHGSKIGKDIEKLNSEIIVFDSDRKKLISDHLTIDEFKGFYKLKLSDTRDFISRLKDLSSKKSQVEVAEEKKLSIEKQIKQLEDNKTDRLAEHAKNALEIAGKLKLKNESISKIVNDIDLEIDNKICDAAKEQGKAVIKKAETVKELDELKENAAVLKNNKLRKETLSKDLISKQSDEKTIKKESSEWAFLRDACSKTGLQALEIDGAAPLITSEANKLLEKAFGLESQIKIITQDPETGKEVFWIKVIREDGSEDDFSNLSGGQKVWISEALSKGMTIISKQKSGRNFESLYSDENDGALDSEKAIDFMKMKRAVMDIGGFSSNFFISHNPDVVAMADHVIDFGELCNENAIAMDDQNFKRIN